MIKKIFLWKLKAIAKKANTGRVARSGEEAKAVDCYSITMTNKDGRYLVERISANKIHVLELNQEGTRFDKQVELNVDSFDEYDYDITHYYGTVNIGYESRSEFLLNELTGLYILRAKWSSSKYLIPAWWWRRKRLPMPTREAALKAVLDLSETQGHRKVDTLKLMYEIYTSKAIHNRKYHDLFNRLELVLASLAESDELSVQGYGEHLVKGKALVTYEHLKEEREKEEKSKRQANTMKWLTVVLATTAAFQSGLIETSYHTNVDWIIEPVYQAIQLAKEWISNVAL
ncbi:hypothetical protein AB8613_13425 [Vibrio sp. BS-M-Sm-2]|uniref:hypothetical protein n=1 Tax=Vibrio sp. BS-M-Sm-2 TaxID=3241167 RepID=UPI0035584B74